MDGGREQARARATNRDGNALTLAASDRRETCGPGQSLPVWPDEGAI